MSQHVIAMREAQWTKAEAVKWARGLRHWPSRRYRVEGSRAGPSRLVSNYIAQTLVSEYGGKIVEILGHAGYEMARNLKSCKFCKARACGRRACRRWSGTCSPAE